jgi:hypothetical protein
MEYISIHEMSNRWQIKERKRIIKITKLWKCKRIFKIRNRTEITPKIISATNEISGKTSGALVKIYA